MKLILLMFLTGCATVEPPPKVVTTEHTVVVRVPVPTPCKVDIPKRPVSVMPPPHADDAALTAGVIADVRALRDQGQYLDQIEGALKACIGVTP